MNSAGKANNALTTRGESAKLLLRRIMMPQGGPVFEVGKRYEIHLIEGGNEGYSDWVVVSVDMPLIKIRNGITPDRIVNTTSPMFVRAELSPHNRQQ